MEKILISSKPISSEQNQYHKIAKWMISELNAWDLNGRYMPEETGVKCHKSIVGYPIVAKLLTDMNGNPADFGGHEISVEKDSEGHTTYKFNTVPIGSIVDSNIENVNGKRCITISTKLWSDRFPEYFEVLDRLWSEGRVASSWELAINDCEITDEGKILKDVEFLGNCILGSTVEGAVPGAGMLEYAEINNDEIALANALRNDINKNNKVGEEVDKENVTISETVEEETVSTETVENKTVEEVSEAVENNESESVETPEVEESAEAESEETTVEETPTEEPVESEAPVAEAENTVDMEAVLAEKNNVIIEMTNEIAELKARIESLEKDSAELAEIKQAQAEAELAKAQEEVSEYAKSSGYFSDEEMESEEFKALVANADLNGVKAMIADKCVAKRKCKASVETSEKINLNSVESVGFSMAAYLRK